MGSKKCFKAMVRKLWQKEWVVYSKAPFGGPEAVLEYIGRYTHRVAITNNRIVSLKDGKVTFTYRDRRDNKELKEMTLEAGEFIRRFLLHVLPDRFCKIRYFGFLSHRVKRECVGRIRSLADPDFVPPEKREETVEEKMTRVTGEDVSLCPKCRKGHMVKIMELPKPKIMQRQVRIVVIDTS